MSDMDIALRLEPPLREARDLAYALHLACRGLQPDVMQPSAEEMDALIALSDTLSCRLTRLMVEIRGRE